VLSLVATGLDAILKTEWLKYIGAPGILLGLLLVVPAAVLVIRENLLIKKPIEAELADLEEFNGQPEAGPSRESPERRARERANAGSSRPHPHGA
jgi:hypothetical protein